MKGKLEKWHVGDKRYRRASQPFSLSVTAHLNHMSLDHMTHLHACPSNLSILTNLFAGISHFLFINPSTVFFFFFNVFNELFIDRLLTLLIQQEFYLISYICIQWIILTLSQEFYLIPYVQIQWPILYNLIIFRNALCLES